MVKPSQKTAPDDRGYGRGFTRAVHQKDGQVQMGTQLAGSSGGTGHKGGARRRRRGGAGSDVSTCAGESFALKRDCAGEEDPHGHGKSIGENLGFCMLEKCYSKDGVLRRIEKHGPIRFGGSAGKKLGVVTAERVKGLFQDGGRRRRRHRGKDFDKHLKRVIAQHRRYQIARGDKRFKATRGLVKWSRPNKTKRANRVYYRKRKSRRRRRRRKGGGIGASRMTGESNMQGIAQHRAQIHDAAAREIQQELGNMGLKVTLAEAKKELKRFSGIQGQATHAYKALISKCCQSCRN